MSRLSCEAASRTSEPASSVPSRRLKRSERRRSAPETIGPRRKPAIPAPSGSSSTMSACSFKASTALATATDSSQTPSRLSSFSASPIPTVLCGEIPNSARLSMSPAALLTPAGSTMSSPRLRTSWQSRPSRRISDRTVGSSAPEQASSTSPARQTIPALERASASRRSIGCAVVRVRAPFETTPPFSATIASTSPSMSGRTRRSSSRIRPVTSTTQTPASRTCRRESRTSTETAPASASVPSKSTAIA